jgi:hypothetical protein
MGIVSFVILELKKRQKWRFLNVIFVAVESDLGDFVFDKLKEKYLEII